MGIIIQHITEHCRWATWEITESLNELKSQMHNLKYDLSTIENYHSEERKKQWLAVRILTHKLVPHLKIRYNASGKPYLEGLAISISHSHQFIAVAVNPAGDVGIDLQILDQKVMRIQRKFANPKEIESIGESLHLTTLLWSVKEAMYKLYGDGSPYFEKDYDVRFNGLKRAECEMKYNEAYIQKEVELQHFKNFVIALVKDVNVHA